MATQKDYQRTWYLKHREQILQKDRDRRLEDPEQYRAIRHKSYLKHKEKRDAYSRQYSKAHREQINRNKRIWAKQYPERIRAQHLRTKFGIEADEYSRLFEKQNGVCAICRKPENQRKYLSIDHDHLTGQIRGLLCIKCNLLIAYADEAVGVLTSAINYLGDANEIVSGGSNS